MYSTLHDMNDLSLKVGPMATDQPKYVKHILKNSATNQLSEPNKQRYFNTQCHMSNSN